MVLFISALHVLLCVFMIFVILLQPGKDAGMGAALGGGAATSAFGGRGAVTFLGKVTAVCAVAYFLTSLGLSFVGLKGSVVSQLAEDAAKAPAPVTAPAVPGKASDAPKPNDGTTTAPAPAEGAKPPDAPSPPAEAKPAEKAPEGAAPAAVEKSSDKPGTPVPSVPEKKVTGTEAGP